MKGDRSAYEELGLEPGAEREEVDRSYRRLIKQYHPDRPDGDRARAEAIIAAYRSIADRPATVDAIEFYEPPTETVLSAFWQIAGLLVAIGLLLVALLGGPLDPGFGSRLRAVDLSGRTADAAYPRDGALTSERPIDDALVGRVAAEAWHDFKTRKEGELAEISRSCHRRFARTPRLDQFDRCATYDLAIIVLQDRDPVRDKGPFQENAVVRRHWADAVRLTRDVYAIDTRLDRLKLKVELALIPTLPAQEVLSPPPIAERDQRLDELPNGVWLDAESSSESDQRSVSDAANLSE